MPKDASPPPGFCCFSFAFFFRGQFPLSFRHLHTVCGGGPWLREVKQGIQALRRKDKRKEGNMNAKEKEGRKKEWNRRKNKQTKRKEKEKEKKKKEKKKKKRKERQPNNRERSSSSNCILLFCQPHRVTSGHKQNTHL